MVHDRHAVAQGLRLLHVVRRHQDRPALALSRRMTLHRLSRAAGSRPVVGSSRKTTSGSLTSASATDRRCCWPPDSVLVRAFRFSPSSRSSMQPVDRLVPVVELAEQRRAARHRQLGVERRGLELDADALLDRRREAAGRPARAPRARPRRAGGGPRASPSSSSCRRRSARAGRRSRPSTTSKLTPSTALTSPYALCTSATRITASDARAASATGGAVCMDAKGRTGPLSEAWCRARPRRPSRPCRSSRRRHWSLRAHAHGRVECPRRRTGRRGRARAPRAAARAA